MIAIALYGGAAAVHDHHAGRAGDFTAALAALTAARAAGQPTHVVTPITRSNYRVLSALPALLHAHAVTRWTLLVVPLTAGPLAKDLQRKLLAARAGADDDGEAGDRLDAERFAPRLAMALPFALHAIDRAVRLGLDARIEGAPRCLLGRLGDRAVAADESAPRGFAPLCEGCGQRAQCVGIDADYLARFGAGELTRQPAR